MNPSESQHRFVIEHLDWGTVPVSLDIRDASTKKLYPASIQLSEAVFAIDANLKSFLITVIQQQNRLSLFCDCQAEDGKLCEYQRQVMHALLKQDELQLFFNTALRLEKLKKIAVDYGLEGESDLDQHFKIELEHTRLAILPKATGLLSVTKESLRLLGEELNMNPKPQSEIATDLNEDCFVLLKQHKYYKHLQVELYRAQWTKEGKPKNPFQVLNPLDHLWKVSDPEELKFLSGIQRFQLPAEDKITEATLAALRAIIKNPKGHPFYYHLPAVSENIIASAIAPVYVEILNKELRLKVKREGKVYTLSAEVTLASGTYLLKDISLKFHCFLLIEGTLYLIDKAPIVNILHLLKQQGGQVSVHFSKHAEFKTAFLDKLEDLIQIDYEYIKEATEAQLEQNGFRSERERLIYLSDFGNYVMLIPVMRYGQVEIQVRTLQQIYALDKNGQEFLVKRDDNAESEFISLLLKQHKEFSEQLENPLYYFYLTKKDFTAEEWFLKTIEEWADHQITVLGFNEIEGKKINPNRIKVDIKVISGLNWFNVKGNVKFGKKSASFKQLHIAVKNKSKYVKLDDGTFGILPKAWLDKFSDYFSASEFLDEDTLAIPKVNFLAIETLFEDEMLDEPVKEELAHYHKTIFDFNSVKQVDVPNELKGTLRSYQKEGLNWLNFLDDFNFGGCLADDMGLGKSVQIIAFILLQRRKVTQNTNLLIVPTTLIFNWKAELEKFAPDIRVHILQGADRKKNTADFDNYEVVLTSYNTLLTDVNFLKNYPFNYIFLDESQQIKNPESQRYKAARLLKSRNKIAITGTPVENNTFDLYSQFSFACPGLLGSKQHFRDLYSIPVDRFKDSRNARELQKKIHPFLLRRTKEQVAKELPSKTETILYCEMKEEQRKIYLAYEKEFREYISATNAEVLKGSTMHVLRGLTKLRQICNSTALLGKEELSGEGNSSKIEALMEQIEDNAAHHKMLVFSQFVTMLKLIEAELVKRGIGSVMLTGTTKNREAVVTKFQTDPEIKVFLISLKAGGTGLNLVEANYVYLVDPWWNPAVENQAIDRCHRIGQHKNVTAIRLICPGTVEEKIMQMQESKKVLASRLVSEESSFLQSLSKEELLRLLD